MAASNAGLYRAVVFKIDMHARRACLALQHTSRSNCLPGAGSAGPTAVTPFLTMKMDTLVVVLSLLEVSAGSDREQIALPRVEQFSPLPSPFVLMNWHERSRQLDDFLMKGSALASGFVWWTEGNPTPLVAGSTLAISSYANASTFKPGSSEGLPVMGAVLGSAVARVGVRNVTRAEAATLKYISSVGVFRDFPDTATGGSFWYDIAPSIFAASISDLFSESAPLRNLTRFSIGKWVGAAETMKYNFTHTAFSFAKGAPVNNGKWLEADAAAGIGE